MRLVQALFVLGESCSPRIQLCVHRICGAAWRVILSRRCLVQQR